MAAEAELVLAGYTCRNDLRRSAMNALRSAGPLMERYPSMVGHHLSVLFSAGRLRELAVVGPSWAELAVPYWERFRPEVVLAPSPSGGEAIPLFEERAATGSTLAYLCEQQLCNLPTDDVGALRTQLASV
jgi:uncharacterized protein YyaL (SSP411 family)